jgi:tryptophanyl-tRNA synthetase
VGLDPATVTIFKQSDNPDHFELTWIFNCLVTVPFLELGHAYKDKVGKGIEPSVGLFTYPMLQAADIALYHTDVVPVGEDQRQHLEYTREAVGKFNRTYGEIFKEPKTMILEGVGVVPGTDGKKMSKSYKNTIPLFATKDEIATAVMRIVTDSTGERPEHVYAIHALFKSVSELEPIYKEHRGRYGDLKKLLIEDIEAFIAPLRIRRAEISDEDVLRVLKEGAERVRALSHPVLQKVRTAVGVL